MKKLLKFWNFLNIKVAKFKLNHLGFYCKPSLFLIGQSEKSEIEIEIEDKLMGHPVLHKEQQARLIF